MITIVLDEEELRLCRAALETYSVLIGLAKVSPLKAEEAKLSVDLAHRLRILSRGQWSYEVLDRDGGTIHLGEMFDTYAEADRAGKGWQDNPRYGSHEVYQFGGVV